MSTSAAKPQTVQAIHIEVTEDALIVDLSDGRTVSAPLGWYPRLAQGTKKERKNWRLIAGGVGIHWPDLDEDVSVENLLAGQPSAESQQSFQRWLDQRGKPSRNKRGRSPEGSPGPGAPG